MKSPNLKKEVTRLNGILTALNRFMSKSAQHVLPFYQLLKKKIDFEWTNDCEEAFKCLKKTSTIFVGSFVSVLGCFQ